MGQRANFEEQYSGETFQGSYIAGIYYPDKTKVGWWKNGYPEYFAKVLNATNENSMVFEDSVAGIQAANIANMTSIGIGDEKILHEAKYNFKDFTFMDTSFIEAFID